MSATLESLIEALRCLPGVGPKSAQRMAYHLLQHDRDGAARLGFALDSAINRIRHCERCNTYTETPVCERCESDRRDASVLCVVETPVDLNMIEQTQSYNGLYYVLMGRISPLDGLGPRNLRLDQLVARAIGHASRTLYASPAYLAQHGTPQTPEELTRHHLIGNSRASSMNLWERQDAKSGLQVKGQTLTDNSAVLLSMVRSGVGIARLLDIVAAPLVKTGELVPLLRPHFDVQEIPVYAVMLQERYRLPKIRACVDFWIEYLSRRS